MYVIPEACSFCARERAKVEWLVKGPGINICDRCVVDGEQAIDTHAGVVCAFCRAQPASYVTKSGICAECLVLCREIIAEARPAALPTARVVTRRPR
jgi:hypothetical protein